MNYYEYKDYLAHYGVKGMKWGVRRYQNADGTLTNAGKKRQASTSSNKISLSKSFIDDLKAGFETDEYGSYETAAMTKMGGSNIKVSVRSKKGSEIRDTDTAVNFLKKYNDDKARDGISKQYYDDDYMRKEWLTDSNGKTMSRDQFKDRMKLYAIDVDPDWNTYQAYYSDGGTYYGHSFVIEGNMRTGRAKRISLEG